MMTGTNVAFVCVGNAGRSQLATAFAERERNQRDLNINIVTGGTNPADHIHGVIVDVLAEKGIDISDTEPQRISAEDIKDVDHIVTMGCSVDEFCPENWTGTTETWDLDHPSADNIDSAREQRNEIEQRVSDLFDQLESVN